MSADILKKLSAHAFFEGIPPDQIERIAERSRAATFAAGQFIVKVGEPARQFYLLESGHVALEIPSSAGSLQIETLGPDDVLGWSWMIEPYLWRFDARTVEATHAIQVDGEWLRNECDANPTLGYRILKRVAEVYVDRLSAARMQLLDMYGVSHNKPGYIAPV